MSPATEMTHTCSCLFSSASTARVDLYSGPLIDNMVIGKHYVHGCVPVRVTRLLKSESGVLFVVVCKHNNQSGPLLSLNWVTVSVLPQTAAAGAAVVRTVK